MKETELAAQTLGVHLQLVAAQGPNEFGQPFSAIAAKPADALTVFPSPMLLNERGRIVDLAVKHRLPSMTMAREFVELGGLMSYGDSIPDLIRRAAAYVDNILKGAARRYASAAANDASSLGIKISLTIRVPADEVIQKLDLGGADARGSTTKHGVDA